MHFRNLKDRWFPAKSSRVQDTEGNSAAKSISSEAPKVTSKPDEIPQLIQELISESNYIQEGEYDAYVQEFVYGATKTTARAYIKCKLAITGRRQAVFAYVVIAPTHKPFFQYFMPKILHRKVRVKVRNRRFLEVDYPTAEIIRICD